jgi:hypothetical protein
MATTTNYGWTTPNDTDLVKDGAAAIRTLGSSIDTTTKALNPSTTLGDIEYRSSTANTNTRLGIGTSGQVLTVSGGVPSWATSSSGGMTLLSTTTLSGTTTTISSIDQTYINLMIVVRGTRGVNAQPMDIRPNSENDSGFYASVDNGTALLNETLQPPGSTPTSSIAGSCISLIINQYSNTTQGKPTQFFGIFNDSRASTFNRAGMIHTASAISSISFVHLGSGFSGGTVLIYGVK